MHTGMYLFIVLICIVWIAVINIIRVHLQKDAKLNDSYTYFIELTLTDYKERRIVGLTANGNVGRVRDPNHEWEEYIRRNIGHRVRIYYDVTYTGVFFINIQSDIKKIIVIDL